MSPTLESLDLQTGLLELAESLKSLLSRRQHLNHS